jgi:DNA modification methylase
VSLIRGDALTIPLADDSVDLIVTSPPYFALRSYTDACGTCGGESAAAITRGYSPRKCPNCERVFTSGRNKCHVCDVTTLIERETYDAAKAEGSANADPDCPECQGSGRGHYAGQIGSEPTPAAFIDALVAVTQECVRVLKPSGSMFVNLGDKYSGNSTGKLADASKSTLTNPERYTDTIATRRARYEDSFRPKSLMGLPWRYAIRCIDDLGLILRAEIIWSKPNGLPESVQDRVRRSHENWFHFTLEPRYYSAVDEIREPYDPGGDGFRKMKATWNEDTSAYHTKREETPPGPRPSPPTLRRLPQRVPAPDHPRLVPLRNLHRL